MVLFIYYVLYVYIIYIYIHVQLTTVYYIYTGCIYILPGSSSHIYLLVMLCNVYSEYYFFLLNIFLDIYVEMLNGIMQLK